MVSGYMDPLIYGDGPIDGESTKECIHKITQPTQEGLGINFKQ